MKKIFSIFLLSASPILLFGQCDLTQIFPFKTGATRFQNQLIENSLNIKLDETRYHKAQSRYETAQNMSEDSKNALESLPKELQKGYWDNVDEIYSRQLAEKYPEHEGWVKPKYLKKDSIYTICRFLKWDNVPCLNNKNASIGLNFADDTLYAISMVIHYEPEEFQSWQTDYNMLLNAYKKKYLFQKTPIKRQNGNDAQFVQTGECNYFSTNGFKNNKVMYEINIDNYDTSGKDPYYVLIIKYTNVNHTKFRDVNDY